MYFLRRRKWIQPVGRSLPVHLREGLVDVGQRQRGADDLAVLLGDHRPVLVEDRLQVLGLELDLGLGDRHEAPVLPPGDVVDLHEAEDLRLHVRALHVAHGHPLLARMVGGRVDHRRERLALLERAEIELPHQEIDPLLHPGAVHQLAVVRRVPGLEDHRRLVVALDEDPALVVHREVHRAEDALTTAGADPIRGRVEQRVRGLGVVRHLEEAEEPVRAALVFVPAAVDVRRDPADGLAVALGKEVLGLRVLEPRVLLAVEEGAALEAKRRHPLRIVLAQAERHVDEGVQVLAPGDGADRSSSRCADGSR